MNALNPAGAKTGKPVSLEQLRSIEEFLIAQGELLDQHRYEEWDALFDKAAVYWVPTTPEQQDALNTLSVYHDDAQGRDVRIRRLRHEKNLVEETPTRTLHMVQNVRASETGPGEFEVRARFLMLEYRAGVQRLYGGTYLHKLREGDTGFTILHQRVDLLNGDGVLPVLSVPF